MEIFLGIVFIIVAFLDLAYAGFLFGCVKRDKRIVVSSTINGILFGVVGIILIVCPKEIYMISPLLVVGFISSLYALYLQIGRGKNEPDRSQSS